jgi:hypothetical protein
MLTNPNEIAVPNLNDPERLLIWSIREWVISVMRAKDPIPKLIEGFSKVLIQEAVMPFNKMMRTISYSSSLPIDVRCHCSNLIGRTEIDLLCLIVIIQNKLSFDLDRIVKIYNKQYHMEMLKQSSKFVESLNRAAIILPVRYEFINKYQKNKNEINKNIIFYDFKNKTKIHT